MIILPTWDQIPDLDLYLDQVLLYVNQQTSSAFSKNEKGLTAAMVNNYVKHGMLPKPIKKKYNRHHLARLMVLTLCKPVFAISDIIRVIEAFSEETESSQLYDLFVACLQGESREETPAVITKVCQTLKNYHETLAIVQSIGG